MTQQQPLRGRDMGPFDISEIDPWFFESLGSVSDDRSHHHNKTLSRLWTPSLSIVVPKGSRVGEEVSTVSNGERVTTNVHALHIQCEGNDSYDTHVVSVAAYARPHDEDAIDETDHPDIYDVCHWDERSVEIVKKRLRAAGHSDPAVVTPLDLPWTPYVQMQTLGAGGAVDVLVLGSNGPRWSVRMIVRGGHLGLREIDNISAMMDSIVVNRGTHPLPPAHPLDIYLIAPDHAAKMWKENL